MADATELEVRRFLVSCYGYGDASGGGCDIGVGVGSGLGSGDGYGRGTGDGHGPDDGDGDGYGFGSGEGSGYGGGAGWPDGYGYGDGHGDIKEYCGHRVWMLDCMPTLIYSVHGDYAKGAILVTDLTLRPCYVARVGNSIAHGDTLREARRDAMVKDQKSRPVGERVSSFVAAHPDPDMEYDGWDLYDWHSILTGSCRVGRDAWCRDHGLDPDRDRLTVREFLRLTVDSYGSEIIRAVASRYEIAL